MLANRDRPHAWPTATMRDAEGLVQVQMRDVGAEATRLRETDESVEVRAVDVDLTSGVVHRRADVGDVAFEDTVRRGIGDHQRGNTVCVLAELCAQVVQ